MRLPIEDRSAPPPCWIARILHARGHRSRSAFPPIRKVAFIPVATVITSNRCLVRAHDRPSGADDRWAVHRYGRREILWARTILCLLVTSLPLIAPNFLGALPPWKRIARRRVKHNASRFVHGTFFTSCGVSVPLQNTYPADVFSSLREARLQVDVGTPKGRRNSCWLQSEIETALITARFSPPRNADFLGAVRRGRSRVQVVGVPEPPLHFRCRLRREIRWGFGG